MGVYYKPFFKLPTFLLGNNEDKKSPPEITLLPVFLWSKQIVVVGSEGGGRSGGSILPYPAAGQSERYPCGSSQQTSPPPKNRGYFFIFVHISG